MNKTYHSISPAAAIALANELLIKAKLVAESPLPGAYCFSEPLDTVTTASGDQHTLKFHITKDPS